MPYKSQAQAGYFHTHKAELEKQGVNVDEWDTASKGKHLPQKLAKGGIVEKGTKPHHQSHEMPHRPSIGGHNDGHGIFATGGEVRNEAPDKFYKSGSGRGRDGKFLGTPDRFTGDRKPAGFPQESETDESWIKPKGVGTTDADDIGDCKKLKPVLPHASGGDYWYGKDGK